MKIIIDIPGGFGNQLFGYAFGYALSKELGCEYYIHTPFQDSGITWELQLNKLNIEYSGQLTYSWGINTMARLKCSADLINSCRHCHLMTVCAKKRYMVGLGNVLMKVTKPFPCGTVFTDNSMLIWNPILKTCCHVHST